MKSDWPWSSPPPPYTTVARSSDSPQAELADRAGLTQAKISRIEGSDAVPTLPLLTKLARALDASLNIAIDADDARVSFTPHTSAA
ncbi:helix-turn-helix transcriptional regulator [Nocardia beijingensis]|uniref:helix-turn-helix domain-containing protein n=1 Tax=Nocardia beijingensis TaxID=95162 RepID=UPI0033FAD10D